MSNIAGLGDLVAQIKEASRSIEQGESRVGNRLKSIEASVNELYKRTGRPAAFGDDYDTDERKDAAEMVIAKHSLDVPRFETTDYQPSSTQIDEALQAMRGLPVLVLLS